jgi:hypothetical protein
VNFRLILAADPWGQVTPDHPCSSVSSINWTVQGRLWKLARRGRGLLRNWRSGGADP